MSPDVSFRLAREPRLSIVAGEELDDGTGDADTTRDKSELLLLL